MKLLCLVLGLTFFSSYYASTNGRLTNIHFILEQSPSLELSEETGHEKPSASEVESELEVAYSFHLLAISDDSNLSDLWQRFKAMRLKGFLASIFVPPDSIT